MSSVPTALLPAAALPAWTFAGVPEKLPVYPRGGCGERASETAVNAVRLHEVRGAGALPDA